MDRRRALLAANGGNGDEESGGKLLNKITLVYKYGYLEILLKMTAEYPVASDVYIHIITDVEEATLSIWEGDSTRVTTILGEEIELIDLLTTEDNTYTYELIVIQS